MIGALDIGGTKIAVGLVDRAGVVVTQRTIPTLAKRGPDFTVDRITGLLRLLEKETGQQIEGIGIGCTGPVYPIQGTIGKLEFLPGWEGYNIVKTLQKNMHVSVFLENDADAGVLGEWVWGCGRGMDPFMLVTIGTGIGVGLILKGALYRGADGAHPEMGHHFIDPSGPLCSCGGYGCWECMASGTAMERWAEANHPQKIYQSAQDLCQAADEGEELALKAVNRSARYLALGLANLVTIFIPKMIALTGGLMSSAHLFLPEIHTMVHEKCGYVPNEAVIIQPVDQDTFAGLRGAAQVWLINSI